MILCVLDSVLKDAIFKELGRTEFIQTYVFI